VVNRHPLLKPSLVKSVLETFAPRASAELERKRAEDLLRESEERYRAFIASSSDAMWRIEFEKPISLDLPEDEQIEAIYQYGYVAECNPAMSRLAGAASPEELAGMPFAELFPRTDERIREELRSAARSGFSAETYSTTPRDESGRVCYRLRTQCGIVENDELRRIWGTTRDITELKRAELAVEASERRFREVLENVQLPALMLDEGGRITFCNAALLRLTHSSKEELIGRKWLELISFSPERDIWAGLITGPSDPHSVQHHFEGVFRLHDIAPRLITWDTTMLRNQDGGFAGLAAIGRDMTDQKILEAQLLRAEKLDGIGRLAGGVAHDFNNLLTVIIGQTSMLLNQTDAAHPNHSALTGIAAAAGQCALLTQQLLAIGRRQRLLPERVNLNDVIAGEEPIIRRMVGEGVEITTDLEPSLGFVHADPVQIRRILANLAINARDAMPAGGTLTFSTSNIDPAEETAAYLADVKPGRYVRLLVIDTGIGLTEEIKERMFDPFFTTKPPGKGTGLGLSTVYGIVVQSGGHIFARGEPGAGTTIEILLPRGDEERLPPE
jgi:PAS domain S-box-containing protein